MPRPRERVEPMVEAEVAAFLRANPFWLADNPALYRVLAPPARVHGEHLADHMAAMLHAERAHAALMAEQAEDVLAAGRAAAGLTERVQRAVLALLRSPDPLDCINDEMPGMLGVDAVALCVEGEADARVRSLPPGTVARLMHGRQVLFRAEATDARLLHQEAAGLSGQDVLVIVPGYGAIGPRGGSEGGAEGGSWDEGPREAPGEAPKSGAASLAPSVRRPPLRRITTSGAPAESPPPGSPADAPLGFPQGFPQGSPQGSPPLGSRRGPSADPRLGPTTPGPPALLALLARDPRALVPGQGISALAFLGQAVAAALGR